ncbi:MAG: FAD-dependent oxidoreductase, partial [Pseudomonadota bacterium]
MRIAVVGAGIAGLGAAWLLSRHHDVVVFEEQAHLGGHAQTSDVPVAETGGDCPVDIGFIVYNTASYPNLIALFDQLDVPWAETSMSFAVSESNGRYAYSGSGLGGLFGKPASVFSPAHWQMVRDIFRFFERAKELAATTSDPDGPSLGAWLEEHNFSRAFIDRHIVPMGAAIWSTPAERMLEFPAAAFARFFANHGLLQARGRPKWRTVVGGSREYVRRLTADTNAVFRPAARVRQISRDADGVDITCEDGAQDRFDACVVATHADTALDLLADADATERTTLGAFAYSDNLAVLHRDPTLMPKQRRLWSSWNYCDGGDGRALSVTYWMNRLQPLQTREDWFVTLNPPVLPRADLRHCAFAYAHPVFDRAAMRMQPRLWDLQGRRRTWFCGSYFGFGFHEDGLQSGLAAAEDIGGAARPWVEPGMY